MASVGSTNNLYIGNRAARDRTFNGLIDSPYIFNRVLNASEIAWVMNETKTTSGNLTTWHDAGSGNETYQLDVNFSTSPANSNYTVYYRRNNTGDYVQVGTANHNANQSITLSTKYQNTDIRVRLEGNSTATPELTSITFYTQTSMPFEGSAPSITNVQNGSVGDTWGIVNFTVNQSDALTHIEYNINSDLSGALITLNQSSGTDRSVNITALENGTTYYYSVYAWNSSNTSLWTNSSIYNFTTNSNVIPPINGSLNKYTIGSGGNLWNGNSSLGNTRIRQ